MALSSGRPMPAGPVPNPSPGTNSSVFPNRRCGSGACWSALDALETVVETADVIKSPPDEVRHEIVTMASPPSVRGSGAQSCQTEPIGKWGPGGSPVPPPTGSHRLASGQFATSTLTGTVGEFSWRPGALWADHGYEGAKSAGADSPFPVRAGRLCALVAVVSTAGKGERIRHQHPHG